MSGGAVIDLNADLGETVEGMPTGDDEAMFAVVSSANVACGAHAGDIATMIASVARAQHHGVAVGAHPSYPDRVGFGRVAMRMPTDALRESIAGQLDALRGAGAGIRYVKAHGALYHAAGRDRSVASALTTEVARLSDRLGRPVPVLGLGETLQRAAQDAGIPFVREAFLDRGYLPSGALVPRGEPGALLADPGAVAARAVRFVREGVVDCVTGESVAVDAASLCVHGDSPGAVAMARAVRAALADAAIEVRAPW